MHLCLSLVRFPVSSWRVVFAAGKAPMDTTQLDIWSCMVGSLRTNGCSSLAGMEKERLYRCIATSRFLYRSAHTQCNVVMDILRAAKSGVCVWRDNNSLVCDSYDADCFLEGNFNCWRTALAISFLGLIRSGPQSFDMADEFLTLHRKGSQ